MTTFEDTQILGDAPNDTRPFTIQLSPQQYALAVTKINRLLPSEDWSLCVVADINANKYMLDLYEEYEQGGLTMRNNMPTHSLGLKRVILTDGVDRTEYKHYWCEMSRHKNLTTKLTRRVIRSFKRDAPAIIASITYPCVIICIYQDEDIIPVLVEENDI
jgi:hypothetical protein